jgi:hypothetical protein
MPFLARGLITFVIGMTLVGSNVADWNRTHIFSETWSPHARFHGAWFVFAVSFLSVLSLWLLWSPNAQPDRSRIAAYLQGCIWLAFILSMLVPETLLADPGNEVKLAGIDLNLLGTILNLALLGIALVLLRRNR